MFARYLAISLLLATPIFAKGKIKDSHYVSTKNHISFALPEGWTKVKVKEKKRKDQATVLLVDLFGSTLFLEQIDIPTDILPYFEKSDEKALADFFGKAIMSHRHSIYPETSVIDEAHTTIHNQPAYYALISSPGRTFNLASHEVEKESMEAICVFRADDKLCIFSYIGLIPYEINDRFEETKAFEKEIILSVASSYTISTP